MGAFKELDIARRNELQWGVPDDELDLAALATQLGGEVDGDFVRCPSPGQPPDDRSCFVRFKGRLDDFFIYDCVGRSGAAYAFVRASLKLGPVPKRDHSDLIGRIRYETLPAPGTVVERYLRNRALTLPVPACLRLHRILKHAPTGSWHAAMVAERSDVNGEVVAIHRTFLQHDGSGKAAVEPPRLDLGPTKGTAIRLSPLSDELLIGEGIETTLSVMQVTGKPGWAAGSAVMLRQLLLPREVRSIVILADGDEPGERSAVAAGARWQREGREVRIKRAPPGTDFNDLLMAEARHDR